VDTVIFALILLTLGAAWAGRRKATVALFLAALGAAVLLFHSHVTDALPLNF
jgi:hypothetical protein